MKKILSILIFASSHLQSVAQQPEIIGHLKSRLVLAKNEATKVSVLDSLSMQYFFFSTKMDSIFYYATQFVDYALTLKNKGPLILAYARMGFYYVNTGQLSASLAISMKGVELSERYHIRDYLSALYQDIAWVYMNLGDDSSALKNCFQGIYYLPDSKDPIIDQAVHVYGQISSIYQGFHNDSAYYYCTVTDSLAAISKEPVAKDFATYFWSSYYLSNNNYTAADSTIAGGIRSCEQKGDFLLSDMVNFSANSYLAQDKTDLAIDAAYRLRRINFNYGPRAVYTASALLRECYQKLGNIDSAYHYYRLTDSLRNEVYKIASIEQIQNLKFNEQINLKEKEANQVLQNEKTRNKITLYIFLTALFAFLTITYIQWRHNKQRKKATKLLQEQKNKVESTLHELRSTQAQLIQSEKMASLGELTAGIAHEIQNPLNFVNNFSDVNKEMLAELNSEIDKRNYEEVKAIAKDITDNEEKINHHGKRADAIVKGMLQHSRSSSGQKEPTDINALCDEYLRLAYHGLRAKDKSFNANFKTGFDNSIGKINVVPQEIGRVILNLINNAFYAVGEKQRQNLNGYEPTVIVSTKKIKDKIEIKVDDNGNGIPQKIVDKIFQPFFTTKPTGQGTGLGLSLAYDIITKGHGGELKVETKEGEGSAFLIRLPVN